jgi:serine protein kinase
MRSDILNKIANKFDKETFQKLNEEMSFSEYLELVYENPKLARTSYQYLYDMIMSKGTRKIERYRRTYIHYNFFDNSEIPIFGLEETLHQLVQFFRGAAGGYGPERRVLLLHGPVGSSKSTILRSIKRGLEKYSLTDDGAWYTFKWVDLPTGKEDGIYTSSEDESPMHEDPLKLLPLDIRKEILAELNQILLEKTEKESCNSYKLFIDGELDPRSKKFMQELLLRYEGDWGKVIENHIKVIRKTHSESDRIGIATFQPKDEKNQDSTELTGDINWGKLPHFGTDSDPRAFNFDGEFCVGNRGIVEFIEVLKLAKEFLYDLLGASQERSIKPKKFPQVSVDTVLIGHSVHESTPIPFLYEGVLDVLPISEMQNLDFSKLKVFSVNEETNQVELTAVSNVFSHDFEGEWVENHQNNDVLITTPNHSVYRDNNGKLEQFYPGDDEISEIATFNLPDNLLCYEKTDRWHEFFK